VLARQLFETATAVKFILQRDTLLRATMFAAHEDQRALVLIEEASQVGLTSGSQENVERQRAKVKAWEARFDDVKVLETVRRHWSGQSLKWAQGGRPWRRLHDDVSLHVRLRSCSDVGAHVFVKRDTGIPTLKLEPGDQRDRASPQ
jgi:hypothetical protein